MKFFSVMLKNKEFNQSIFHFETQSEVDDIKHLLEQCAEAFFQTEEGENLVKELCGDVNWYDLLEYFTFHNVDSFLRKFDLNILHDSKTLVLDSESQVLPGIQEEIMEEN